MHNHFQISKTKSLNNHQMTNNPTQDPNINYNILHSVLQQAKERHIPTKYVKYNICKHKKSPCLTTGIIQSIHYRDNLYKNAK